MFRASMLGLFQDICCSTYEQSNLKYIDRWRHIDSSKFMSNTVQVKHDLNTVISLPSQMSLGLGGSFLGRKKLVLQLVFEVNSISTLKLELLCKNFKVSGRNII